MIEKKAVLIGNPVDHSLSPVLHGIIADKMNQSLIYTAERVEKDSLNNAFNKLRNAEFAGANVTAPYKKDAYDFVDELAESALLCGSVNTIVNKNGRLIGHTTDGEGLYKSMVRDNIVPDGKNVLLLGAGGVACPVCMILIKHNVKSITVKSKTKESVQRLAEYINKKIGFEIGIADDISEQYDIVINATGVGMDNISSPIDDFSFIGSKTVAVDLIYNPAKTPFLCNAEKRGAKIMNGLGMLVYQGISAYEKFMDVVVPQSVCDEVVAEMMGR